MNDWYERSMKALQLHGVSLRTQQSYTRMVRMLVDFYGKTPDLVTEEELQEYFLHKKNVCKWSGACMRICYCAIRFFFVNVLERKWHTCVPSGSRSCRRFLVRMKHAACSPVYGSPTSMPTSPPSILAVCVWRKPSVWKSLISTATG